MHALSIRRVLAGVALVTTIGLGGTVGVIAQDLAPADEYPAHILEGTCADLSPTSAVELQNLLPIGVNRDDDDDDELGGEMHGTLTVGTVTYSDTDDIEFDWDTMLGAPHAILVYAGVDDLDNFIACGDIGGLVYDDNDKLVIGIQPVGDSGYFGMAFLEKDDSKNLDVEVYMSGPVSSDGENGTSVVATPSN